MTFFLNILIITDVDEASFLNFNAVEYVSLLNLIIKLSFIFTICIYCLIQFQLFLFNN